MRGIDVLHHARTMEEGISARTLLRLYAENRRESYIFKGGTTPLP